MRSDSFFSLFGKISLIFILLGVVSFGAYYFGTKNIPNQNKQTPPPTSQPSSTPTQEVIISTPTPIVDEGSILKQTIKNALVVEHGNQANSLNITVSKIEGGYASGGASEQGGGAMWFAAKINGIWKLVWDGNGVILCSNLTAYPAFPSNLISECWNDKTQQSVKR